MDSIGLLKACLAVGAFGSELGRSGGGGEGAGLRCVGAGLASRGSDSSGGCVLTPSTSACRSDGVTAVGAKRAGVGKAAFGEFASGTS